jgi:hypothetical protein
MAQASLASVYHEQKSNNLKCNKFHFERLREARKGRNAKQKEIGFSYQKASGDKLIEIVSTFIELSCISAVNGCKEA